VFDLKQIKKTTGLKAPFIVCYGTSGVGKTTFAAGAPNPIFIQTEQGEGSLEIDSFVDKDGKTLATTLEAVLGMIDALIKENHNYETLVIDSLDHLEPLIHNQVCAENNKTSIEKFDYGKGFTMSLDHFRLFLRKCSQLRTDKTMAIILIAHHHIKRFESPEHEAIDRYDIKLHAKASGLIQESVDAVLFAKHKTTIKKEDKGFGQTRARGIHTGERVLVTAETPSCVAKNRYGLPQEIDLSWDAFQSAIAESLKSISEKTNTTNKEST